MEWTPDNNTSDLEDRRGDSGGGYGDGGFGGGGGGFGGGGIGLVGLIVLIIISLITGRNFVGAFLHGGGVVPTQQVQPMQPQSAPVSSATEQRDVQLMNFTLNDVQKFWAQTFAKEGRQYTHAKLVLYRGTTRTGGDGNRACGAAQAQTGPFYCPGDQKVYIDLSFWNELRQFGGSTADFAQAYVLSHELGHHVQNLLGTEAKLQQLDSRNPSQKNRYSVALELQADCYGGVWAHDFKQRGHLQDSDVADALSAVAAVGDDHLQKMSGRAESPETWTHGSSAQREHWFNEGFNSGDPASCNTFAGLN